jgi:hypothetical protein
VAFGKIATKIWETAMLRILSRASFACVVAMLAAAYGLAFLSLT